GDRRASRRRLRRGGVTGRTIAPRRCRPLFARPAPRCNGLITDEPLLVQDAERAVDLFGAAVAVQGVVNLGAAEAVGACCSPGAQRARAASSRCSWSACRATCTALPRHATIVSSAPGGTWPPSGSVLERRVQTNRNRLANPFAASVCVSSRRNSSLVMWPMVL